MKPFPTPSVIAAAAALILVAGGATSCARAPIAPAVPVTADQPTYTIEWSALADGIWAGDAVWPNRLQDWRIRRGGLECHEAGAAFPMRTAAVLPIAVAPAAPGVPFTGRVQTTIEVLGEPEAAPADRWAGVLIGVGGGTVDPWISAQVHHRPALDGGLFCGVDGEGRAIIHDFSAAPPGGGRWSIGGPLDEATMPRLASGEPTPQSLDRAALDVSWELDDDGAVRLTVIATGRDGARSVATVNRLDAARVAGAISAVSHRGVHRFESLSVDGALSERPTRFGPIVHALYTVSRDGLVLTAQCVPVTADQPVIATLAFKRAGTWEPVAEAPVDMASATARFHLPAYEAVEATPYRVALSGESITGTYGGVIRAAPSSKDVTVAALSCHKCYTGGLEWNANAIWFPHHDLVGPVRQHDPDLVYFAGDQVYEGDLTAPDRRTAELARLDYLQRWYRWGIAFSPITRDRPTIVIPDDHDVYQGNLWGAGGRAAAARELENGRRVTAQDSGGYVMPPDFVNMVHRTQTGHLPPPTDPRPDAGAISVYTTQLEYAGLSFAIIADRQWKSAPAVLMPEGEVINGWFHANGFEPSRDADPAHATLLGEDQLAFLERWATDWRGDSWMKVVLSQTPFANVATLPADAVNGRVIGSLPILGPDERPPNDRPVADADSGAWPPTPRRRAILAFRRGFAVHLNGDQHLGALVQYGVDGWRDSGYSFSVPAIANAWPRRWFPATSGRNRSPEMPPETGDFIDGFGHPMTVWAVCNPQQRGRTPARLHDAAPGYGIVRFERDRRRITFSAWPRGIDPRAPGAQPYAGFPRTVTQLDQFPPKPLAWLPRLEFERDAVEPVVEVRDDATGRILYSIRNNARRFRPWVPSTSGTYTIRVGAPDRDEWREFPGLRPTDTRAEPIVVPPFRAP